MSDALDTSVPWPQDDKAPWFTYLQENWPARDTARDLLHQVHRKDVERAAAPQGPVVVNVTVPGMPGHFTGEAGGGTVAYVPGPAPELPGSLTVAPESRT